VTQNSKPAWPPGFVPQVSLGRTETLKSAAATKGRKARAKKGIQAWGTNTVEKKP